MSVLIKKIEHRDKLLLAVNRAASILLTAEDDKTFKSALAEGMEIVGCCADADRVEIWQNEKRDRKLYAILKHYWTSKAGKRASSESLASELAYSNIPQWKRRFMQGEHTKGPVSALSKEDKEFFSRLGVKSVLVMPIFIQKKLWGFFSIEDCRRSRDFTKEEADILLSVGYMLVNTINRQKIMKELQAASKAKGDFLSAMSHEIRTPINAIIGMTAIGKKSPTIEEKNHALGKIEVASAQLLNVINDVLDIAKIEANKLELTHVRYDFEAMLEKIVTIINYRVEEKQQILTVDVDNKIPRFVTGDDKHLAQVITNLLTNALKFTPEGGKIHLEAALVKETDNICKLQISVSDSGIGISEKQQERLFQAFEQAESQTGRKYGGTGLGLVISKRIVELMGGKIRVESELGKGAKFIFTVKLQRSDEQTCEHLTVCTENKSGEFTGRHLLLVEDVDINREIMITFLQDTGINIDCAENGEEAVKMVSRAPEKYDIILMDIQMPKLNGYEATKKIRELFGAPGVSRPALPIIAMTANVFKEDVKACIDAGMNDHLGKPLDVDRVLAMLRKYL